jgi:carboxypeptidase Taq
VTYILHIILRYEIEKGFIAGELKAKDLPQIWNKKMEETLGIIPETDALGCLQDVHWSCGLIGYFPTYALGNLYAGALYFL